MDIDFIILLALPTIGLMYYLMIHLPDAHRKEIAKKLGDAKAIQLAMDRVREKTNIGRVVIMQCNNGKEISKFGSPIYVSGVYQSIQPPFSSQLDIYKSFPADGHYIKLLKHVLDNGSKALFTVDLPESFLKRVYESEGVNWSYVFSIGSDGEYFYFGSLATNENKTPFQIGQGLEIEVFLNEIRRKYKKLNLTGFKRIKRFLKL